MDQNQKETNLDFLESFAKGDKQKMKKYVSMYLGSTSQVIIEMQKELEAENWQNLRLKAHSIKPQVQYMGVDRLKAILLEIETIIIDDTDKSPLPNLVSKAVQINNQAIAELKLFVESN